MSGGLAALSLPPGPRLLRLYCRQMQIDSDLHT